MVLLGLGGLGFASVMALTSGKDLETGNGTGRYFSPPGKPYRVEIPKGVVEVSPRKDSSIPSETDLSLELQGRVGDGGLIKTGTLSGPAASGTFNEIGDEAARKYTSSYEDNPDQWGTGAKVDKRTTTVGGRDAIEVSARFSPTGDPEPTTYFKLYFIDPPVGAPILVTCDWNTANGTADIEPACDALLASFKINN